MNILLQNTEKTIRVVIKPPWACTRPVHASVTSITGTAGCLRVCVPRVRGSEHAAPQVLKKLTLVVCEFKRQQREFWVNAGHICILKLRRKTFKPRRGRSKLALTSKSRRKEKIRRMLERGRFFFVTVFKNKTLIIVKFSSFSTLLSPHPSIHPSPARFLRLPGQNLSERLGTFQDSALNSGHMTRVETRSHMTLPQHGFCSQPGEPLVRVQLPALCQSNQHKQSHMTC